MSGESNEWRDERHWKNLGESSMLEDERRMRKGCILVKTDGWIEDEPGFLESNKDQLFGERDEKMMRFDSIRSEE